MWTDRIIGHEDADPEQLLAHPSNWRIHPIYQSDYVEQLLELVGWVRPIIVNQRTQMVLDGHLRVMIALRRDEATVPVAYVDLSNEEEAKVLATFDPLALMAEADNRQLSRLLDDIGETAPQLSLLLDDLRSREVDHDLRKLVASNPLDHQERAVRVWVGSFMYETAPGAFAVWKAGLQERAADPAAQATEICRMLGIEGGPL